MDKFVVRGGKSLQGTVSVSGAKNSSIAMMPACLLASGVYRFSNTPNLRDVWTMSRLLGALGVHCELNGNDLFIDSSNITSREAPYEHVKKMRASFYVLGPLLGRYGEARVSLPGGCAWGPRPVDFHLKGMEKLGAQIDIDGGYVNAKADALHGARIQFDVPSVGATINVMMAAVLAKGSTLISNAAVEPEVTAQARLLQSMGARIDGVGTSTLEIEGVTDLHTCDAETIPDRIEASTYMIGAAITRGNVTVTNLNPYHCAAVIAKLEESGAEVDVSGNAVTIKMDAAPQATDITTAVYPGFPTDVQAQWVAYMLQADGPSRVKETIYTDRFKHVPELARLGADVEVIDNTASIRPGKRLSGATVMSTDLRASASLILAALVTEGRTEILRVYHIDRGYENIEKKLAGLGADIRREQTDEF